MVHFKLKIYSLLSFLGGLLFSFGNGMYLLDIVDHWVGNFAIFSVIILQCIVFGTSSKVKEIAANVGSWMKGNIFIAWHILFLIVLPSVFFIFLISQIKKLFVEAYGKYPWNCVLIFGWGVFVAAIIAGIVIAKKQNRVKQE